MCQQLPEVGKGVGPDTTVSVLLPEVFELTRDEEPTVRAAALTCLVCVPLMTNRLRFQFLAFSRLDLQLCAIPERTCCNVSGVDPVKGEKRR